MKFWPLGRLFCPSRPLAYSLVCCKNVSVARKKGLPYTKLSARKYLDTMNANLPVLPTGWSRWFIFFKPCLLINRTYLHVFSNNVSGARKKEPPYTKLSARESLASMNARLASNTYEMVSEVDNLYATVCTFQILTTNNLLLNGATFHSVSGL